MKMAKVKDECNVCILKNDDVWKTNVTFEFVCLYGIRVECLGLEHCEIRPNEDNMKEVQMNNFMNFWSYEIFFPDSFKQNSH